VNVIFMASVAVVAPDPPKSRELFVEALGLPLEASPGGDYFHTDRIDGSKHFGVWPLSQAAQACFGTDQWPPDPAAVAAAAEELRGKGFELLHDAREEPWGQTVARLLSIEGSIIGISYAPQLHDD
jgi:catechol 2,3-dioxygenase-like lactoylglutathione lyase family enzyme